MAARWFERLLSGENRSDRLGSLPDGVENDSSNGIDHTWMFESRDPERRKLDVGSTFKQVVAWRWDCGVET